MKRLTIYFGTMAIIGTLGLYLRTQKKVQNEIDQKIKIEELVDKKLKLNKLNIEQYQQKKEQEDKDKDKNQTPDSAGGISFLKNYPQLAQKYLMTLEEKQMRRNLLKNESLIRKSFIYLTQWDQAQSQSEKISDAITVVDYLGEAISWTENPARSEAIEKAKYFLLNDILQKSQNQDHKRSLAVNKSELFLVLKKYAPKEADFIRDSAIGTPLAQIIHISENL